MQWHWDVSVFTMKQLHKVFLAFWKKLWQYIKLKSKNVSQLCFFFFLFVTISCFMLKCFLNRMIFLLFLHKGFISPEVDLLHWKLNVEENLFTNMKTQKTFNFAYIVGFESKKANSIFVQLGIFIFEGERNNSSIGKTISVKNNPKLPKTHDK